jgi:hypothetical protein
MWRTKRSGVLHGLLCKAVRATERSGGAESGACSAANGGKAAQIFLEKIEQHFQLVENLQIK